MKLKIDVLEKHMFEHKLNGLKISSLSGISNITLSRIKNGASCNYDTALKIAKVLNIPVQELIESDQEE